MSDLSQKVPKEAVALAFSGIMAISKIIYEEILSSLATLYGVPVDDDFKAYVTKILNELPPIEMD